MAQLVVRPAAQQQHTPREGLGLVASHLYQNIKGLKYPSKINLVHGSLNVPFWEYWTSPKKVAI